MFFYIFFRFISCMRRQVLIWLGADNTELLLFTVHKSGWLNWIVPKLERNEVEL